MNARPVNSGVRPHLLESMGKIFLIVLLVGLSTAAAGRTCSCLKASEEDVLHGANEDIEYSERRVKRIYGKVTFYYGDEPVKGAVVEIYDIPDANKSLKTHEIISRHARRDACVTASDGSFCFSGLPSGKYVLRAGTGESGGMNEVYMRVNVDRRWWSRWFRSGKAIELGLTPGT